ncbi:hypothetical protein ACWD7T_17750 [Streptomyces sp. 900116325]|uniref:hypothetical protein n=1 Tax=Streptomyces sp. NPDC005525 TaxID=3364720 RepID=UPI00369AD6F7
MPGRADRPRYHKRVNVLRTRELLDDVFGASPVAAAPPPRIRHRPPTSARASPPPGTAEAPANLVVHSVGENVDSEARRQAAARQVSPVAAKAKTDTNAPSPVAPPPPAARPRHATHQR